MMNTVLYGLQVAAVGMLVVFAGLVLLIVCISIMQAVIRRVTGKGTQNVNPKIASAPAPAQVQAPKTDDGELIAVITAAVAAMLADENGGIAPEEGKDFVVRQIRRAEGVSAWNRAGREEQVYSRL